MFEINGLAGHNQFPPFKMTDAAMQKMRIRLSLFPCPTTQLRYLMQLQNH